MKILNKIFNHKYYSIKNFEQDGKIYEILGVKWFKRLLIGITRNRENEAPFNGYFLKGMSKEDLIQFLNKTKKSERSHVIIAIVILLYQIRIIVYLESFFDFLFLLFFTFFNVITNIYPIFLQRYNRIRIKRIIQKMK